MLCRPARARVLTRRSHNHVLRRTKSTFFAAKLDIFCGQFNICHITDNAPSLPRPGRPRRAICQFVRGLRFEVGRLVIPLTMRELANRSSGPQKPCSALFVRQKREIASRRTCPAYFRCQMAACTNRVGPKRSGTNAPDCRRGPFFLETFLVVLFHHRRAQTSCRLKLHR